MTRKVMKLILDRAMSDEQFRDLLLTDPDKVLAEYNLTPVEIEAIKVTELAEVPVQVLAQAGKMDLFLFYPKITPPLSTILTSEQSIFSGVFY